MLEEVALTRGPIIICQWILVCEVCELTREEVALTRTHHMLMGPGVCVCVGP
jgi:hypothetical protein